MRRDVDTLIFLDVRKAMEGTPLNMVVHNRHDMVLLYYIASADILLCTQRE